MCAVGKTWISRSYLTILHVFVHVARQYLSLTATNIPNSEGTINNANMEVFKIDILAQGRKND